ncbi:O-antigen ligase family protein [Rubellicoccus peritrichatus]|uniref:O-antigen ligase family protein n=1 Tax=Rubellicoccus peritrichatus TaxID=3080537 RepID=A0AAQ3QX46_9BACT|nr:O-antigen ligase family protein [Puniceicoccus sp. CR14]WOO42632.1 O-antigen ligase family protein [Puniceicoccus sp. CR14]
MNQGIIRLGVIAFGIVAAIYIGLQAGEGVILLPGLLAAAVTYLMLCLWRGVIFETVFSAFLVIGYFSANRGFAQLAPISGLPLFLGEIGLGLGLGMIALRTAITQRLPFPITPLSGALIVWMIAAGLHLFVDLRNWGILAVRDFAMIFYALFFFIGFTIGQHQRSRQLLINGFFIGLALMFIIYPIFKAFEPFFIYQLTFRGIPVIYFKGDLVGIYGAAGSVLFFWKYRQSKNVIYLIGAAGCLAMVGLTLSRAAMLGLVLAAGLMWMARVRSYTSFLIGTAAAGFIALTAYYTVSQTPVRETQLYSLYEHARSIVDISGTGEYRGTSSADTGHNNRFRLVWWRALTNETLREAPLFGFGFGYNLANPFIQEYYPGADSEVFTARSPHNFLLTLFGRTGIIGFGIFLFVLVLIAGQTKRLLNRARREATISETLAIQIAIWVVFIGAALQVVLEGPMGAIPFWLLLGLSQTEPVANNATDGDLEETSSASPQL